MRVHLELFGVARLVAGVKELTVDLEDRASFRDVVRYLRAAYPALVGDVIQPDGKTLQSPNIFNLNAKRMIQSDQMNESPQEGDRIILMSMSAGG